MQYFLQVNILTHTTEVKIADWQYIKIKELRKKYSDDDLHELYGNVCKVTPTNVEKLAVTSNHPGSLESTCTEPVGSSGEAPESLEETKQGSTVDIKVMGNPPRRLNQAETLHKKLNSAVQESTIECIGRNRVNQGPNMLEDEVDNLEQVPAHGHASAGTQLVSSVEEVAVNCPSQGDLSAQKMIDYDDIKLSGLHVSGSPGPISPECDNNSVKKMLLVKSANVKEIAQAGDQLNDFTSCSLTGVVPDESKISHDMTLNSSAAG